MRPIASAASAIVPHLPNATRNASWLAAERFCRKVTWDGPSLSPTVVVRDSIAEVFVVGFRILVLMTSSVPRELEGVVRSHLTPPCIYKARPNSRPGRH